MRVNDTNKPMEHQKEPNVQFAWTLTETHEVSSRSRFTQTLLKYSKLYCRYTKLSGFKYFAEPETTWFDRTLWFLVYLITVPMMVYTVYSNYLDFIENNLFTTMEMDSFPTHELNFPGVSICSTNRISRRFAMEMANEVSTANISDLSFDEILDMILQLGDLYDSEFLPQKRFHRIDQLLTVLYNGFYSITDVMKRLTPHCSSVLSKCRFHDKERNCSELFEFRKTQYGFCCTFNYVTKADDMPFTSNEADVRREPMKVKNLSKEGGLSVLLEPLLDDYFYPIFPTAGWMVTIFNPQDYPDMTSGGVIDFLISPRTLQSVEVNAVMFYSKKSITSYSLEERDCVFPDEMAAFREFYTYSDCIVDCRIEDMWKICGCVPFYLPNRESRRVCNLEDVSCLSQHKSKWFSVIPHEHLYSDEEMNKSKVLYCYKCYPECSDVKYAAKMSTYDLKSNLDAVKLLGDTEVEDQAAMTVYFNQFDTLKLRQDVVLYWYELMGDSSGICGIFVGFSLIAIVEFAYFVGLFVFELLKGPALSDRSEKRAERKQPSMQTIYWGELYSKARPTENQRDRARGKH